MIRLPWLALALGTTALPVLAEEVISIPTVSPPSPATAAGSSLPSR